MSNTVIKNKAYKPAINYTFNSQLGIHTSPMYVSKAMNQYFTGAIQTDKTTVKVSFGIGYKYRFINRVEIFAHTDEGLESVIALNFDTYIATRESYLKALLYAYRKALIKTNPELSQKERDRLIAIEIKNLLETPQIKEEIMELPCNYF